LLHLRNIEQHGYGLSDQVRHTRGGSTAGEPTSSKHAISYYSVSRAEYSDIFSLRKWFSP